MEYSYDEARKTIHKKWIIGISILAFASVSTVISVLKMFYFSLDDGDPLSHAFAQPIKLLVAHIYQNTHFLEYFWRYSPTPSSRTLLTSHNAYFLVIYLLIFVALTLIGSARSLSARLAAINQQIEDEMIKASVSGNPVRQRHEIQNSIPIQRPAFFGQFHSLYLAPIIAGVIVMIIAKLTRLT